MLFEPCKALHNCHLQDWRGARFTFVYRRKADKTAENQIGMEVACKHPAHQTPLCRRRLHFSAHGGLDLTERALKQWIVKGAGTSSQPDHKAFPVGDVLTLDELETMPFES